MRTSWGQDFELWFEAIRTIQLGITLWNASKLESDDAARDSARALTENWQAPASPSDPFSRPRAACFSEGDVLLITTRHHALRAAQRLALAQFDGQAIWSFGATLPGNRDAIELTSSDLVSGIWLQFVAALAAESQFGTCDHCGSFFDATAFRRTRKYCSD